MNEDVRKSFSLTYKGWHLVTSLQINFFINNFKGF